MKHRRIRYGGPRQAAKKPTHLDTPVEILSLSLDGRGVARPNGKTLFVRDALPGEQVEVTVEKSGKRFEQGSLVKLITASSSANDISRSICVNSGCRSARRSSSRKHLAIWK